MRARVDESRAEAEVRASSQDAAGRIRATDVLSGENGCCQPSLLSDSSHRCGVSPAVCSLLQRPRGLSRDWELANGNAPEGWSSTIPAPVVGAHGDRGTDRAHSGSMSGSMQAINIVFDGPPSHRSGRFVEVETDDGYSINIGEWLERPDGNWALRIDNVLIPSSDVINRPDEAVRDDPEP